VKKLAFGLMLTAFVGCQSGEVSDRAAVATVVSSPTAIADRTHAFRAHGDTFASGDGRTYDATVDRAGAIAIRVRGGSDISEIAFETVSIGSSSPSSNGANRITITPDGQLAIERGSVTERVESRDDGLEQNWTFATRPGVDADLELRVRVKNAVLASTTDTGLHFRSSDRSSGVVYGPATWIDAHGARTSVPARFDRDTIVLTVPRATLASSSYPVMLDPTISAEFAVDTPTTGPWLGKMDMAGIAFNGVHYLVVWNVNGDIYGTRVGKDGKPVEHAFLIASCIAFGDYPVQVASDGTDFFLVWYEPGVGGRIARVSASGAVLATSTIGTASGYRPSIAFDGTNYLVVSMYSSDVKGQRYSPSGTPVGSAFTISSGTGDTSYSARTALAFDGTNYFAVWMDARNSSTTGIDLYGARITPSGTVLDTSGIAVSTRDGLQWKQYVAYSKSTGRYLVSWNDYASFTGTIRGARVATDGTVLDTSSIAIGTPSAVVDAHANTFDGTNFVVAWVAYGGTPTVYAARVDTSGTLLDTTPTTVATQLSPYGSYPYPALDSDGTQTFIVWTDNNLGEGLPAKQMIAGARLSTSGTKLDSPSIPISTGDNSEATPSIAYDGTNYLVAWQDLRDPAGGDIYAARVSKTGTALDSSGIAVSTASGVQQLPSTAFDGTNFWIVWQDGRNGDDDVYAARVDTTGKLLDSTGIAIAKVSGSRQSIPGIACNSTTCLIAWEEPGSGAVKVTRVSKSGAVLDGSGVTLTTAAAGVIPPGSIAVATDGSGFLVAWVSAAGSHLYGNRVSGAGVVLDTTPIAICTVGSGSGNIHPTATHDGTNYVLAWEDFRVSGDIYAGRVSSAGVALDPTGIVVAKGAGLAPKIAAAPGAGSLVVYGGTSGSWISTSGKLLDSTGVVISSGYDVEPAVATGSGSSLLVAYGKISGFTTTKRVMARVVGSGFSDGTACLVKDQCASRFCVDGVCCSTLCDGACLTCGATGSLGKCVSVTSGDDADSCTGDTTCDPTGACRKKSGLGCTTKDECASGFCADSYCCESACSGGCDVCNATKGKCTAVAAGDPGASPSCAPYSCGGGAACPTTCTSDAGCATGFYCAVGGTCTKVKDNKAACDAKTDCASPPCRQCASGFCVDGYCCGTACDGPCDECSSIPGKCTFMSKGATGAPSCGPFVCTGTDATCTTSCVTSADCSKTGWCDGTVCKNKGNDGDKCTSDEACVNDHCVDGVCCDSACVDQCEACDIKGSEGKCTPVLNDKPHAPRAACLGGGDICAEALCDGVYRKACKGFVGEETVCVPGVCKEGVSTAGLCDGKGKCVVDNRRCEPFACVDGLCKKEPCAVDVDCARGYRCDTTKTPPTCVSGNRCDGAHTITGLSGSRDCSPYACTPDGLCLEECHTTADCADGFQCDDTRKCVPAAGTDAGSGCGCRVVSGNDEHTGALAAIAALLLARRRRTRRLRREP